MTELGTLHFRRLWKVIRTVLAGDDSALHNCSPIIPLYKHATKITFGPHFAEMWQFP